MSQLIYYANCRQVRVMVIDGHKALRYIDNIEH